MSKKNPRTGLRSRGKLPYAAKVGLRGRGRDQFLSHGDPNGRKTIPVRAGGDGDGNLIPANPPRFREYSVAGSRSVQISPRRPNSVQVYIQNLTLIPQLISHLAHHSTTPQPREHKARCHQSRRAERHHESTPAISPRPSLARAMLGAPSDPARPWPQL